MHRKRDVKMQPVCNHTYNGSGWRNNAYEQYDKAVAKRKRTASRRGGYSAAAEAAYGIQCKHWRLEASGKPATDTVTRYSAIRRSMRKCRLADISRTSFHSVAQATF